MNLVSSFTDDFLFPSLQQKNEIKKVKYPNGIQTLTFLLKGMCYNGTGSPIVAHVPPD